MRLRLRQRASAAPAGSPTLSGKSGEAVHALAPFLCFAAWSVGCLHRLGEQFGRNLDKLLAGREVQPRGFGGHGISLNHEGVAVGAVDGRAAPRAAQLGDESELRLEAVSFSIRVLNDR